jgi:hypothetical protein
MFHVCNRIIDLLIDPLNLINFYASNVVEHFQLMALMMFKAFSTQISVILNALVDIHELVFWAIVADFSLVNLSGNTIHDLSAAIL